MMIGSFFCNYRDFGLFSKKIFYGGEEKKQDSSETLPSGNKSKPLEESSNPDMVTPEDLVCVEKDIESKGANYIQNANKKLNDLADKSPTVLMRDYLADNDDLQKYYETSRTHIVGELTSLRERAKGTKISALVDKLADDFLSNFDSNMLSFFEAIKLRENPVMIGRMLQNSSFPNFKLTGEMHDGKTLTLPGNVAARTLGKELIVLNVDFKVDSYEQFKQTFVHESLHAYVEGFDRKSKTFRVFGEGITEMLASRVVGYSAKDLENYYPDETFVAETLYSADPEALMSWYSGAINDREYKALLKESLDPRFVDKLFSLGKIKETAQKKAVNGAKEALSNFYPLFDHLDEAGSDKVRAAVFDYIYGNIPQKEAKKILTVEYPAFSDLYLSLRVIKDQVEEAEAKYYQDLGK